MFDRPTYNVKLELIGGKPDVKNSGCSTCIHSNDSVEECELRRCVHAISSVAFDCYEPRTTKNKVQRKQLTTEERGNICNSSSCESCPLNVKIHSWGRHLDVCYNQINAISAQIERLANEEIEIER